jgi:hypothetical protein
VRRAGEEFDAAQALDVLLEAASQAVAGKPGEEALGKPRPALCRGGRLAIIDVLPRRTRSKRRELALYALGLRARTSAGAVHSLADFIRWTTGGLRRPLRHPAVRTPAARPAHLHRLRRYSKRSASRPGISPPPDISAARARTLMLCACETRLSRAIACSAVTR